jgi:hypothetical protein
MRFSTSIGMWAALGALAVLTAPARADDTGIAGIHTWQRVGNKTCMADHFHDGMGNGQTQPLAMREAVKSWEGFTDLEYGSDWGQWANAAGKTVSCGKNISDISCSISAKPCKVSAAAPTKRVTKRRRQ